MCTTQISLLLRDLKPIPDRLAGQASVAGLMVEPVRSAIKFSQTVALLGCRSPAALRPADLLDIRWQDLSMPPNAGATIMCRARPQKQISPIATWSAMVIHRNSAAQATGSICTLPEAPLRLLNRRTTLQHLQVVGSHWDATTTPWALVLCLRRNMVLEP
jgi:hypothetical protein